MDYRRLEREDFDAIVTGEMTHYALWFEEQLEDFIIAYFVDDPRVVELFDTTFVRRRDFSASRKLELAKMLLKDWLDGEQANEFLRVIREVETLIAIRNALAHGRDVGGAELELVIEITSYGGKTRTVKITPDTHEGTMATAERCLDKLKELKLRARELRKLAT